MICLSFPQRTEFSKLHPDQKVYTFQLWMPERNGWLLCDSAYLTPKEAKGHFWYKQRKNRKGEELKKVSMPLKEYVERAFEEISPMNPFEAINRVEWMGKWVGRLEELGM